MHLLPIVGSKPEVLHQASNEVREAVDRRRLYQSLDAIILEALEPGGDSGRREQQAASGLSGVPRASGLELEDSEALSGRKGNPSSNDA